MDEDKIQTNKVFTILVISQTLSFSGAMVEEDKEKLEKKAKKEKCIKKL